jgi:radical SAM protein with 4Fe4S-binding SPASM domain
MIALQENQDRLLPFKWEWERRGVPVEIRPFFPWGEPSMAELGEYGTYPPGMPCPFPWQHLVVQWNGDVVPCCRDYNGRIRLGTVLESSLREIWDGERYATLRQQMRSGRYDDNEVCRRCMSIYYTEPEDTTAAGAGTAAGDSGGGAGSIPPDVAAATGPVDRREDLPALWREAVLSFPDRTYIVDDALGARLSYAEAGRVVDRVRTRLLDNGVGEGDHVVICCPIHSEALLLFWAAVSIGAVVIPVDPTIPAGEVRRVLSDLDPVFALVDGDRMKVLAGVAATVVAADLPGAGPASAPSFAEWLERGGDRPSAVERPTDLALRPAVVLFTSGTTGSPKGVILSHQALGTSGRRVAEAFAWRAGDVLLSPGELHTISGLRNPLIAIAAVGAAAIVASPEARGSAVGLIECAARCRASLLAGVPAMLEQMTRVADRCGVDRLSALRGAWVTGAFLEPQVRASFEACFGVPVAVYYGLTETGGFCAGELPDRPRVEPPGIGYPVGSVLGVFGDDGQPVAPGAVGELWIQGPSLMLGYLNDRGATRSVFSGPWFRTGDLARRNGDGGFEVVGRRGEVVKNAHGELVSAREVEIVLQSLPEVDDAAVCVRAGADGNGCLHAAVVPVEALDGRAARSSWLAGVRELALDRLGGKRMPATISILTEIPRVASGDVRRARLERMLRNAD